MSIASCGLGALDARLLTGPITKPICVTVSAAIQLSGLGRTTIYELMQNGTLSSVRIGAKRLIHLSSLEALLSAGNAKDDAT
jgi:excisionase family DNA binding protein